MVEPSDRVKRFREWAASDEGRAQWKEIQEAVLAGDREKLREIFLRGSDGWAAKMAARVRRKFNTPT